MVLECNNFYEDDPEVEKWRNAGIVRELTYWIFKILITVGIVALICFVTWMSLLGAR